MTIQSAHAKNTIKYLMPQILAFPSALSFDLNEDITAPYINVDAKPRVAVLREQGVNGQIEMGAVFDRARFEAIDVHMTDLISGRVSLDQFNALVACGGFSYGDVLGAGGGWAKSILFNPESARTVRSLFHESRYSDARESAMAVR